MVQLVAIYARHSTDMQTHSTARQIQLCEDHCRKAGYTVVETFCDEAISGASIINRPGIHGLIDAALEGQFEHIVTEDLSRLSRDQGDIANLYKRLGFLNISIETVSEGAISELNIGLQGTMNALYLVSLADRTRRGQIASILRGSIPGGTVYGYDLDRQYDQKYEIIRGLRKINEEQANTIRWIFNQYAQGTSLDKICFLLNRQGIESPKGKKWAKTTLIGQADRQTGILRQTLYKGEVTFNRHRYVKNPETGRRNAFLRPREEWIKVPAPELAIMDEKLFDKVQDLIEKRSSMRKQRRLMNKFFDHDDKPEIQARRARQQRYRKAKPRKIMRYVFSGKLWCAEHDTAITVVRKRLYNCKDRSCSLRNLRHEPLMRAAVQAMLTLSLEQLHQAIDQHEPDKIELEKTIEEKNAELKNARTGMRRILETVIDRRKTSELNELLDEKEAEIIRIKYDIKKLKQKHSPLTPFKNGEAEKVLESFRKAISGFQRDPDHQPTSAKVTPWFRRFSLTANMVMTIEYNWIALLSDLRR